MRISGIHVANVPPVIAFEANGLSDLIVIAGPNGVGKTRLISQILASFRSPQSNVNLTIEPTNAAERSSIGEVVTTSDPSSFQRLASVMHQNRRRRDFQSKVIYFESSRTITNIQPLAFAFEFADPFEELISWDTTLSGLGGRWADTQHAILKRIQSQRASIATRAVQLRAEGKKSMNLDFDDPLNIFRESFFRLLGPKTLKRVDLASQTILYEHEGQEFPIETLSSGEREVVTICFDFLLRKPSDCIVFFDEPEVHLHPELLVRLVSTLRSVGKRNQFFFLSHSPDLISSALEDTVIFLTPSKPDGSNQAIIVKPDDEANELLHSLGQSIGVMSLGKKIVIIEGQESSLDRQTYIQILRNIFPQLVLVPAGGRDRIDKFEGVVKNLLNKSIWGISFYLYTDRDTTISSKPKSNDNLRRLKRYHLENYFLDSDTIAQCFEDMESPDSWLRDKDRIFVELCNIAREQIGYVTALTVSKELRDSFGNISLMPSGSHRMTVNELIDAFEKRRVAEQERYELLIGAAEVHAIIEKKFSEFEKMVTGNSKDWVIDFPGKPILAGFCGKAGVSVGRFKTMYINAAMDHKQGPFDDIVSDFSYFAQA